MEEVEPCHKRCINPAWSAAAGEAERRGSWCPGVPACVGLGTEKL